MVGIFGSIKKVSSEDFFLAQCEEMFAFSFH